ncbi:DUF655 domain-containing protein [Candidatus Micrarchaeota archaeon]|nr:MAG: DUF655 domain-containing protein [Candidatus Micrarchaeota archaeon]
MLQLEETATVIDYLPLGKSTDMTKQPIVQLLGNKYFTLLEATLKPDKTTAVGEVVNVGKENRDKIDHIKGRINYSQLTTSAKNELKNAIHSIIMKREMEFVNFFNRSGAITMRINQLNLLPGVGKKHLTAIMSEREKKPFESMTDIAKRVSLLPDPANLLVQRIEQELRGGEKHYLFVRPPSHSMERRP